MQRLSGSWKRQLHLWHRWLGIALGLLVLLWFGSGIVMLYVPYPALSETERMAWLTSLTADQVTLSAGEAWQASGWPGIPTEIRLNSVGGRAAYHFKSDGRWRSVWADTGALLQVSEAIARASAASAAPDARTLAVEVIDGDQWSFGRVQQHRPLYRVSADDAAGSVLYVSGRTGELVRDTTRSERAWNWAGSVIHWIYFTPLRTHGQPWRQVVMWSSGAAFLLVLLGMVLGLQRLRLRRRYAGGRRSPYRGWQAWHHWLGLGLGTLTLTWLLSGWLSVTPFNALASPGITPDDRLAFAGGKFAPKDMAVVVAPLLRAHPGLLELEWRRVDGTLYFSALDRQQRTLLTDGGAVVSSVPEAVLYHAVRATRPEAPLLSAQWLYSGDHYYYSHHAQVRFPVLRVRFQLDDQTTFYIDPAQATLVAHADRHSQWNRWLFNGLHQLDFAAAVRARPAWDVLMVSLCVLGAMLSVTGLVLGWRRLRR